MVQSEFNLNTRLSSDDIFYRTQINKMDKLIYPYSTLVPRFLHACLQLAGAGPARSRVAACRCGVWRESGRTAATVRLIGLL
jgi:hypothetical protein